MYIESISMRDGKKAYRAYVPDDAQPYQVRVTRNMKVRGYNADQK